MKLVIIYGPPAVGKLTVAKELAALTNYKLFHNHLTVDLVESLFKFGSDEYWKIIQHIREYLIKQAAKSKTNLIFTFVYAKGEDDEIINRFINAVESSGGEVCLVQLKASIEELKKRIVEKDRKQYKKMTKKQSLEKWLAKYQLFSSVPGHKSLVIDNTNLSSREVASQIANNFKLP
jgi:shikimate kinase